MILILRNSNFDEGCDELLWNIEVGQTGTMPQVIKVSVNEIRIICS